MNQSGRLQGTPKEETESQIGGGMDSSQTIEPSTKGTANNIRHSQMAFANDIAQGLIHEVRKLQTTLQEKDRLIKDMEVNMADGEKEKELAQRYLRQKTISEEKLKEDNWNLEVANQDLQTNQSELNQTIAKLNVDHKRCLQDLRFSLEQMEISKAQQEKAIATIDAMKARHDHEQQLLRRNNGILHRDMVQLKKQLEAANTDLKICRSKLAIKATVDSNNNTNTNVNHQQSYGKNGDSTGNGEVHGSLDDGDTTKSNITTNASGLAAISQQRALEIDTLKQSLGHAHRMISSLRSNLQKEKVEKIELKKLLMDTQESMDQLQKSVANHDASHTGRGQSKKNSGTNRTKVVRKRGAVGRKAVATTKTTHEFSGDDRQDFSTLDSALDGNGVHIQVDQDDFLSCDDDTSVDDSSSADENNNADSDDSGAENDCHQLDLPFTGQGQSLDMELKLGGFDAPFKPLSSELEESFAKRQYVDKGVNTTTSFEQVSLRSTSRTNSEIATTNSDKIMTNNNNNGIDDGHSGTETGDKTSENTFDIIHNSSSSLPGQHSSSTIPERCPLSSSTQASVNVAPMDSIHNNGALAGQSYSLTIPEPGSLSSSTQASVNVVPLDSIHSGGSLPGQHSSSTIPERCPLSSSTQALVNIAPLDSMHSPIPVSSNTNQLTQQYQQQMDSTTQLMNTDSQNKSVSQQEGIVTPLPGSPVSSQQCPHPTKPAAHEELQQPLTTNTGFEQQETIPIIENATINPNSSGNESHSSVPLANQLDNDAHPSADVIKQNSTGIALDTELVIDAKQIPKTLSPASPVNNNDFTIGKSSDEACQYSVTMSPTQLDISSTSPPAGGVDKTLEHAILAPSKTDEQTITAPLQNDTHSNHESMAAATPAENNQEVHEESQRSLVIATKYDSLDTTMDTYAETEPLDDTIVSDNFQPDMDISNMVSRDEAEALIKAGIADALEKERVESAARQQNDLSNNFVTLAEAEAMARDRTEAALKKERHRTSTMLTKTQADIMARAYAEEAIQETNDKRHSHELATRTTTTTTTSSFLAKVKITTSVQDESSVGHAPAQRRTSQPYMAPIPQPSTSTASTATTSSTSSRRSILSGLMKLQPSISTPAKNMKLRPSASTSSLRKTNTSSSSSSSSKPPRTQRQVSNNALHQRYKATADQHLQPLPSSAPSYGTVRITETSTYPRKPSSAHQQGHLRKPSLHSLSSNISNKSGLMPHPSISFPIGDGDLSHHSSAELISAITQTMIGEWMWKHTRKHMGGGISENKHKRFFWVHPYTRTLYWGNNEPGVDADEAKAKSAFIESVSSIPSSDTMGASPLSLLIKTAKRDLKLTAQSLERHELWRMSLSYLLVPPGEDYSAMEDVIQVDPFHHEPDTATLATTIGSGSTQTLPIAATNATCHDSLADDDAIAKEVSAAPMMPQDLLENDEHSDSRIQGSDSTNSDDHDMETTTDVKTKTG